ncbi:MAG TPA: helix-turn-helix domain-containing protein [Sphingomonas sp.]
MTPKTPTFYLYGEPHRMVEDGFVHAESLDDRSRANEWTIRPHSHAALGHIFFVASGGGVVRADAERLGCRAPCLLLMPATIVHSFDWEEETSGSVVTLATRRLSGLAWLAPETAGLLARCEIVPLSPDEARKVETHIADLMLELGWARIGHDAAVQATLLAILVIALRSRAPDPAHGRTKGHQRALVARLRERIEERFRLREPVADYAAALGTSETVLRVACARVAGQAPAAMMDQRALLEARRSLLFSDLSVGEIAYSLGFDDPAYFSRFFARHVGRSPRRYRAEQRGPAPHGAAQDGIGDGRRERGDDIGP